MDPDARDEADALLRRTTALLEAGPSEEARALLAAAVRRFPANAALAGRHGDALQLAGRADEARAEYRRALALEPRSFENLFGLGCVARSLRAFGEASEALARAVELRGDALGARLVLAESDFELGEVERAVAGYRAVIRAGGAALRDSALASLATIVPGCPSATHAEVLAGRSAWIATIHAGAAGVAPTSRRKPSRGAKLRVAYLSAFFGARHWMKPVYGVLAHHDRARFEIHWIADGDPPSVAAGWRDSAADVIWPVQGVGDGELAERVAAAGIDVLVDLNGYSHRDRFGLLVRRAAPVQLGWFNHFATSGCAALDALVGDAETILPQEERHCRERLLRVPGSCLAFDVNYPVPPVAPPPCLGAGRLTFGCLGSAYKITPQVASSWSRILRSAPSSRLLLKNPAFAEESNRAALARRFEAEGIAADRIRFEGGGEHFEFLRGYDRIDVALDTFPYNGGTTTTEALWQGVPVATFDGDRWAGRTSRSLLVAAGLAEWVAPDRATFEARSAALAADPATPAKLAELRSGMRARLQASPVCDTRALCRALEAIYESEAARRS